MEIDSGPSFAKRKEWRYVLVRICEFLRLVDYLIQELLTRIVTTSVRQLHEYVAKATEELNTSDMRHASHSMLKSRHSVETIEKIDQVCIDFNRLI